MQAPTVFKLSKQQHDDLMDWVKRAYMFLGGNDLNLRAGLEYRDRLYYRETDWTKEQLQARWANMFGDAKKLQNMTVPVVQPQVEQTVGYLMEVFCSGEPFFGCFAPPDMAEGAKQMEAVIADNSRRFGWRGQHMMFFRDALKYNLAGMEWSWETRKTFSVMNDPVQREEKSGVRAEELYSGNRAKRLDMYNVIIDTRVHPSLVHKNGEFAGYVDLYPRTQLKQYTIDLGFDNVQNATKAFQSNCNSYIVGNSTPGQYYIPLINPYSLIPQNQAYSTNWMSWVSNIKNNGEIEYRDLYEVATIYARILPSDFKLTQLTAMNTPCIIKMIVVNQQWIIYTERMSNAHNFLPTVFTQPFNDGLGYQSKGCAENIASYQEMASALWNSAMESKRRLVYDRIFYDPSRISKTDIDKTSAVARIPVKATAYGKPVGEAVHSMNYRDDNTVGVVDMATRISQMAQQANGTNNPSQGQFQKGNKTRAEFEYTVDRGNWRPRLFAITLEDDYFESAKEIVKMNVIQYQGNREVWMPSAIPGAEGKPIQVDSQTLRKSVIQFKLTDGMTPSERFLDPNTFGVMMQLAMAIPQVTIEYDLMGMAMYQLKVGQGAYWIDQFKRTPEQQQVIMQQQAAAAAASNTDPAKMAQAAAQQQQPTPKG